MFSIFFAPSPPLTWNSLTNTDELCGLGAACICNNIFIFTNRSFAPLYVSINTCQVVIVDCNITKAIDFPGICWILNLSQQWSSVCAPWSALSNNAVEKAPRTIYTGQHIRLHLHGLHLLSPSSGRPQLCSHPTNFDLNRESGIRFELFPWCGGLRRPSL